MPTNVGYFCSKFRWLIFAIFVVVVATAVIVPVVILTSEKPATTHVPTTTPAPTTTPEPGCDPTFPDPTFTNYTYSNWACIDADGNPIVPTGIVIQGTQCKRRCSQGQISEGVYTCSKDSWTWTDQKPTCDDNMQELLYFFTTRKTGNQYTTTIKNPPDSNIMNSAGVFTSMADGLHLFTLSLATGSVGDIQLKRSNNDNNEVLAAIPTDDIKTNSLAVTVELKKDDKVEIEGGGILTFTGVSLYSSSHTADRKCLWGNGLKKIDMQNIDQPIILQNFGKIGVDYNATNGSVTIQTPGVYMITLNLGSDDSSYASLDIKNVKTLGLGEDRDGRNVMSNFLLKYFNSGDTIQPTLEALSNIYDDNKQTQFAVTSLIDEATDWSFCAYSSKYIEFHTLDTVKFDIMFKTNGHYSQVTGNYSHPYEEFNPKRFYLLSVNAFMGKLKGSDSAELKIEQWQEDESSWVPMAEATTTSPMRSMLQVSVIAQMDQNNNAIRVRAKGFMDEGPNGPNEGTDKSHFANFCGFCLGV